MDRMGMQQPAHWLDDDRRDYYRGRGAGRRPQAQEIDRWGVRVRTIVHEDDQVIDEPTVTEQVEVERIPLGHWVEAPVLARQEGDTTIVTSTKR
jgi:hypothetical protein